MKDKIIKTQVAIIGSGLAGLTAAIELADYGKKVILFSKGDLEKDCNSFLLAGGLTAVKLPSPNDSYEKHIEDTLKAGKFLNDKNIVEYCAKHFYPDVIEWLIKKGVLFDYGQGKEYDLHREGGHSENRVYHIKDTTGKSIMHVLASIARKNKNITIRENFIAIDLITKNRLLKKSNSLNDVCYGVYVYDIKNDEVKTIQSDAVFIASGGIGKAFLYTSNTDVSTGDGFGMSLRAGLNLVNMEFIQFHPTVFYDPNTTTESERRFLLTEALRGSGAFLKLTKDSKKDFVLDYDPLGSAATRDVVSRAEDEEMRKNALTHIWLDCTKIKEEKLKKEFKNSYDFCRKRGYNLSKDPVPVVYAEHYSNGGVEVRKNSETQIKGIYVLGETSYTGLHGATRLASNSGPECILFARLAAKHFEDNIASKKQDDSVSIPLWDPGRAKLVRDKATIAYYWETIRRTMTSLCGIVRNEERLDAALEVLLALKKDIDRFYWNYTVNKEFLEVRNIIEVAIAIVRSSLARKETRACHFREDFSKENNKDYNGVTILNKDNEIYFKKLN